MRRFWRKRAFVEPETIKVSLHPGYKFEYEDCTFEASGSGIDLFSDVSREIDGSGYSFGGPTTASKASSYDTASDQARFDAVDISWTTSSIAATYVAVTRSLGDFKASLVEENWLPMARLNGPFSASGLGYLRRAVRDAFLSGVYDATRATYVDLEPI